LKYICEAVFVFPSSFLFGLWFIFIFHHVIILLWYCCHFILWYCLPISLYFCAWSTLFWMKVTKQIREARFRFVGIKSHLMLKP